MRRNMNTRDRVIRAFVVAPVAIVLAVVAGVASAAGLVLLVLAAVMVVTAVVSFCPLYALVRRAVSRRAPLTH